MLVKVMIGRAMRDAPEWTWLYSVGWSPIRPPQITQGKLTTGGVLRDGMHLLAYLAIKARDEKPWRVVEVHQARLFWWNHVLHEHMMGAELCIAPITTAHGAMSAEAARMKASSGDQKQKQCLTCGASQRTAMTRGCCNRCYSSYWHAIRIGTTTWGQIESQGRSRPLRTKAEAWERHASGMKAFQERRKGG